MLEGEQFYMFPKRFLKKYGRPISFDRTKSVMTDRPGLTAYGSITLQTALESA